MAGVGSASDSGRGPGGHRERAPGLRPRRLNEKTAVPEPRSRRRDVLRRRCAELAAAAWDHIRPTRTRTTGYVAIGAVGALIGTSVAVGVGAAGALPHLADIGAWLGSAKKGEVAHADGLTGAVDGKVALPGMDGHRVQISQDGKSVLVLDEKTGRVVRIDGSQLTAEQSADYGTPGMQLVSGGAFSYLLDPAKGTVQQIDPLRTTPIGGPVSLGGRLGTAVADPEGTLWVPVPGNGQVVPVTGGHKGSPVEAGKPGDTLVLTLAAGQPVVTDTSAAVMKTLTAGAQSSFNLQGGIGGSDPAAVLVPQQTDGPTVPVLAADSGWLALVDTGAGQQTNTRVPVGGHRLGTPQILGHRVYIPDQTTGSLLVYNKDTAGFDPGIRVTGVPGRLDLFVRDGLLWANDQDNAAAAVVGADGKAQSVGKYSTDVPTARKPQQQDPVTANSPSGPPQPTRLPQPPTAPPAAQGPPPPPASKSPDCGAGWQPGCPQPMAPGTPQVASGSGTITVTFAPASGTTPKDYTLAGAPAGAAVTPSSVGPNGPFTFQVRGGSCAQQYTFTVIAHYTGGAGDKASPPSAPAHPCQVPTAPTVHVSVPQGGHGATVSWSGANGSTYTVNWPGGSATTSGTSRTITGLRNSNTYNVTVTATNAAGSAPGSATIDLTPPARGIRVTDNTNNNDPVYIHTSPWATTANRDGKPIPAGDNSTVLTVHCQVTGVHATNNVNHDQSSIWDRIDWNGRTSDYVSDLWVNTANHHIGRFSPQDLWQCT